MGIAGSSGGITSDSTDTLTNKTIDGDNNTISNLAIGDEVTGASTALTDTANITYDADTDASTKGWVIDEDDMSSDSATKVPTQQSVKAYVDTEVASVGGGGLSKLNTTTFPGTANKATISSISQDYKDLQIRFFGLGHNNSSGAGWFYLKLGNGTPDSGSNYVCTEIFTAITAGTITTGTNPMPSTYDRINLSPQLRDNDDLFGVMTIHDYTSTGDKLITGQLTTEDGTNGPYTINIVGKYTGTSAVDTIYIRNINNNMTGTVEVWGMK